MVTRSETQLKDESCGELKDCGRQWVKKQMGLSLSTG